jgi:hypothetical protein
MTGVPDPEADLLQRIAVGDADPSSPEVRRALAADRDLAARVERLLQVQRALSDAGRLEREVLDEAMRPARPVPERRRQRRWSLLLAALVVVGAVLLGPWSQRPDTRLGTALAIEGLTRAADGSLQLRWDGSLRPGDYYAVTLRRPTDDSEVARSGARLVDAAWTLPPLPGAPDSLRVEIEVLDALGQRLSIARRDFDLPR